MIGGSGETNISGDANKFSCTLAPEKLDGWVRWLCVSERELRKGERRKGEEVERERERERQRERERDRQTERQRESTNTQTHRHTDTHTQTHILSHAYCGQV